MQPAEKAALAKIKRVTGESINRQVQKAVTKWVAANRRKRVLPVAMAALLIGNAAQAQERTVQSPDGKGRIVASGARLTAAEAAAVLAPGSIRPAFYAAEPEGLLPWSKPVKYYPGDGPFGAFPKSKLPPIRGWSQISYPLPHPMFDVRLINERPAVAAKAQGRSTVEPINRPGRTQ